MHTPIMTNAIIKQLGKSTRYHKILGYGRYAVAVDADKEILGLDGKKYKAVTIISSQYSNDKTFQFALIKQKLRKKNVHVLLSSNFEEITFKDSIVNDQVRKEVEDNNITFNSICEPLSSSNPPRIIQYDEEWAPGFAVDVDDNSHVEKLYAIPENHYQKLMADAYEIAQAGLYIDTTTNNIYYDDNSGFWFIDLDAFSYDVEEQMLLLVQNFLKLYPSKFQYLQEYMEKFLSSNASQKEKQEIYAEVKKYALFSTKILTILNNFCKHHSCSLLQSYVTKLTEKSSILQSCFLYYDNLYEDVELDGLE